MNSLDGRSSKYNPGNMQGFAAGCSGVRLLMDSTLCQILAFLNAF